MGSPTNSTKGHPAAPTTQDRLITGFGLDKPAWLLLGKVPLVLRPKLDEVLANPTDTEAAFLGMGYTEKSENLVFQARTPLDREMALELGFEKVSETDYTYTPSPADDIFRNEAAEKAFHRLVKAQSHGGPFNVLLHITGILDDQDLLQKVAEGQVVDKCPKGPEATDVALPPAVIPPPQPTDVALPPPGLAAPPAANVARAPAVVAAPKAPAVAFPPPVLATPPAADVALGPAVVSAPQASNVGLAPVPTPDASETSSGSEGPAQHEPGQSPVNYDEEGNLRLTLRKPKKIAAEANARLGGTAEGLDHELAERIVNYDPQWAAAFSFAPLTYRVGTRYSLQLYHKLGVAISEAPMDRLLFRGFVAKLQEQAQALLSDVKPACLEAVSELGWIAFNHDPREGALVVPKYLHKRLKMGTIAVAAILEMHGVKETAQGMLARVDDPQGDIFTRASFLGDTLRYCTPADDNQAPVDHVKGRDIHLALRYIPTGQLFASSTGFPGHHILQGLAAVMTEEQKEEVHDTLMFGGLKWSQGQCEILPEPATLALTEVLVERGRAKMEFFLHVPTLDAFRDMIRP